MRTTWSGVEDQLAGFVYMAPSANVFIPMSAMFRARATGMTLCWTLNWRRSLALIATSMPSRTPRSSRWIISIITGGEW